MSKTSETSSQKASVPKATDAPKKPTCCGSDHDKDKLVPPVEKGQAVPSEDHKHEPARHSQGGSGCCGSGNAKK